MILIIKISNYYKLIKMKLKEIRRKVLVKLEMIQTV